MPAGDFAPRRFDFGHPAVVQQPFTHAGKEFARGETFPYEQLGLDKQAMWGFWLGSLVDFATEAPPSAPKSGKRR